jgi:hypothetical protein
MVLLVVFRLDQGDHVLRDAWLGRLDYSAYKSIISYYKLPVVYMARDVMILMRATSITRAIGGVPQWPE